MDKRQLLEKTMNNEDVDYVPTGFWHHFVVGEDQFRGLDDPSILDRVYEGHKEYYNKVQPSIMKIMSEGFFGYPPIMNNPLETERDLLNIHSLGPDHPWITEQIKHVKRISELFKDKVYTFYNIFAPLQVIRIKLDFFDQEYSKFVHLAETYPKAFQQAGFEIQKDTIDLINGLFDVGAIDGIYYCVQNIQSPMYTKQVYKDMIEPTELPALEAANLRGKTNILHICGYGRYKNNLSYYLKYKARIYNWATFTEGISIQEGKKILNANCVLGGFDNNPGTLIDKGSRAEIDSFIKKLLAENDGNGYIIGADCSIPNDIDDDRVGYICKAVRDISSNMKIKNQGGNLGRS